MMKRTIMIAALAGCASNPEPMDIPDGCNPLLGGSDCFLPYPSDVFAEADPSMPSGRRITLTRPAMLLTDEGKSADPTKWRAIDGYSRLPTIITTLGAPMDAAGLPAILGDPTLSVADDSPTLIVDTVTQRRVPHFVDLDPRATDPLRQALVIHPLQALEPKRRYIVALRGVRGPGGGAIVAPEGFRRLRDDAAGDDPALHELAARYDEDVFEPLAATGVARDTLQLAWDFTTGSDEHVTSDMFDARDRALAALDAAPPTVTIDSVEALTDGVTWRRIRGRITGPSVLDGAELHRDAEGRVSVDGTTTFGFTALIPHSAKDATRPAPFVGLRPRLLPDPRGADQLRHPHDRRGRRRRVPEHRLGRHVPPGPARDHRDDLRRTQHRAGLHRSHPPGDGELDVGHRRFRRRARETRRLSPPGHRHPAL